MNIQLNGQQVVVPTTVGSVEKLLSYYKLLDRIAVVEVNKEIVMKEEYESKRLTNGDVVEIIHFVGGG